MQIQSHPQQSPKSYLAEKLYLFITPIMKFQFIKPYAEWICPISVSTAGAQVVSKGFKANSWFTFCPMTHLSKEKYKWSTIQASVDQGESNERKFHNTVFKMKTVLPRKRTTSVDLENAKKFKKQSLGKKSCSQSVKTWSISFYSIYYKATWTKWQIQQWSSCFNVMSLITMSRGHIHKHSENALRELLT